jgi:hypothetical protein
VGSKSQKEVCPKIAAWLKPRSLLNGKGNTGSANEEKTEPGDEEKTESAKENMNKQRKQIRRARVNKK